MRGVLPALVIEVLKLQFTWHEHAGLFSMSVLLACSPVLFLMRPRICTSVWQHVKTYWNDERLLRKATGVELHGTGKHTRKRDRHLVTFCWKISLNRGVLSCFGHWSLEVAACLTWTKFASCCSQWKNPWLFRLYMDYTPHVYRVRISHETDLY